MGMRVIVIVIVIVLVVMMAVIMIVPMIVSMMMRMFGAHRASSFFANIRCTAIAAPKP